MTRIGMTSFDLEMPVCKPALCSTNTDDQFMSGWAERNFNEYALECFGFTNRERKGEPGTRNEAASHIKTPCIL